MAQTTTTLVIKSKTSDFEKGLNDSKNSFQQWTQSIDSLTGGFASKLTNALANPWTAVAAGVGATIKVTKELWTVGLDAQKGFDQLKASFGSYAHEVDNILDAIDRTTLATKDDLESMAKKISQYGLSTEELKNVLQTTADIATRTGQSFGTVESAVVSALNGQDKALTKIMPEWTSYKEGAENAKTAIINLGDSIHDSTIKVQSGSIAQTLDNMSSSWQNIKENLGTTIVANIQESGILTTIAGWLEKIEEHTAKAVSEQNLKSVGLTSTESFLSVIENISKVDKIEQSLKGSPYEGTRDRLRTANELLDNTSRKENPQLYTALQNYIWEAGQGNIVVAEQYWGNILSLTTTEQKNFLETKRSEADIKSDIFKAWEAQTAGIEWSNLSSYDLDVLASRVDNPYFYEWIETKRDFTRPVTTGADDDTGIKLNWGINEDPLTKHYRLQHTGKITSTSTDTTESLNALESLLYETPEIWTGSGYGNAESLFSKITSAYKSGNWGGVTDSDWSRIDSALAGLDVETRQAWQDKITPFRQAYELSKTPITPTTVTPNRNAPVGSADWKAYWDLYAVGASKQRASDAEYNRATNYGLPYFTDSSVKHDYTSEELKAIAMLNNQYTDNPFQALYRADSSKTSWTEDALYNLWADGTITTETAEKLSEKYNLSMDAIYDKEKKDADERTQKTISNLQTIASAIGTLQSVMSSWFDGKYTTGEIGGGISGLGSIIGMIPGAELWGAGISLAGVGIGMIESLFAKDEGDTSYTETAMDESYKGAVHQYTGGLELHIHNSFENANIVGEGGMGELARAIQRQIELYAYDRNL